MPSEPTPAATPGQTATPRADERERAQAHEDELVDEASDESFPASDPPATTHTHAGTPDPER